MLQTMDFESIYIFRRHICSPLGCAQSISTDERRHKVMFKPIYDELGPQKAATLNKNGTLLKDATRVTRHDIYMERGIKDVSQPF